MDSWTVRRPGRCGSGAVATALTGTPVLLIRMRRQLLDDGRLGTGTAAWMWSTYAAAARLFICSLCAPPGKPSAPSWLRAAGLGTAVVGGVLDLAGAQRSTGPAQLTGTDAGDLITGGIYRYSRHPQYTGIVLGLTGLANSRRSWPALALTGGLTLVYRYWAPVEERHLARHFGDAYGRILHLMQVLSESPLYDEGFTGSDGHPGAERRRCHHAKSCT